MAPSGRTSDRMLAWKLPKLVVQRRVLRVQLLGDVHRLLRPLEHLADVALQSCRAPPALTRFLLTPPGTAPVPWTRLPAVMRITSWPNLRSSTPLLGDLRVVLDHADDVAPGDRVEAEQQVRRGQVEEVQGMGLQGLPVVHQAAHLLGAGGDRRGADDAVARLGRRQVVAHRADAAQALHQHRHFPVGPALDELLEAAELDDVQPRLLRCGCPRPAAA